MALIHINGKEYKINETIRNVKRTFEMQKKFFDLDKKVNENKTEEAIDANLKGIDGMVNYIVAVIDNDEITSDYLMDNVNYQQFNKIVQNIISKILHIDEEEEKNPAAEPKEDQPKE